jgi:hypothetical protein
MDPVSETFPVSKYQTMGNVQKPSNSQYYTNHRRNSLESKRLPQLHHYGDNPLRL